MADETLDVADMDALERLRSGGDDLSEPRRVSHFLVFLPDVVPDRTRLESLINNDGAWSFDQFDDGCVIAETVSACTPDILAMQKAHLEAAAQVTGFVHEGWEVRIIRKLQ